MAENALAPLAGIGPKVDFVGPTVDDDVRRIIWRYGAAAVQEAVKRQTRPKRGRRKIPDWKELRPFIEEDALLWLQGEDPFALRKDYAIAKVLADAGPVHYHAATMDRIKRKLRGKQGRKFFVYFTAMEMSRDQYSFKRHISAIRALKELAGDDSWDLTLTNAIGRVANFEQWNGEADDSLTMAQIEEGAKPKNALAQFFPPRGIFGNGQGSKP